MGLCGELRIRLGRVRDLMGRFGVSAFYVSEGVDLAYLTSHDTGRLLVTNGLAVLWVKDVYYELYKSTYSVSGYPLEVRVHDNDDVRRTLRGLRSRSIGVSELSLKPQLSKVSGKRVVVSDLLKCARQVKTKYELDLIGKSSSIARQGMWKAREVVGRGVRELDAVAEIQAHLYRRGSEAPAFGEGMLLASGRGSADIHAKASRRRIGNGTVVVDLGAVFRGYHSDMTRTLVVGVPSKAQREVLEVVRDVYDCAVDFIRPGVKASAVHDFVDVRLSEAGYKLYHRSGHGVGLEIHEYPSFGPESKTVLEPGMVFTVEPGVYLPGMFGARFENTLVLTRRGCRSLT